MFFGLGISTHLNAQTKVGVRWEIPDENSQVNNQLVFLSAHHIDLIIIDQIPTNSQALAFEKLNIPFIVDLNNQFLSEKDFNIRSGQLIADVKSTSSRFDSLVTFSGIVAFKHSTPFHSLKNVFSEDFIQQGDSIIKSNRTFAKFLPALKVDYKSILHFKSLLDQDFSYLIINFEWLKSTFEEYPEIEDLFLAKENLSSDLIPLPKSPKNKPLVHWSIIVLLLLWISLAVNVGTNPTYLETIPRYFTAHRFFVDDIMSYRERTSASAIFLLFQHAVFGGLVTYVLVKLFISDIGLEALYYHVPYIAVMGQNYFSLFVLSAVVILLVEMIALLWIYIPNKEMTHFNQALNLFTWIFHLDFIFATIIVTAYFAEASSYFIVILSISYLLVWFLSFNITALAASKKLGMNRNAYLIKTIVLHTIASIITIILFIVFNDWWDVLELITSI